MCLRDFEVHNGDLGDQEDPSEKSTYFCAPSPTPSLVFLEMEMGTWKLNRICGGGETVTETRRLSIVKNRESKIRNQKYAAGCFERKNLLQVFGKQ